MDYMNWYEKCLCLARIKANGGEMSEFEKSELENGCQYSEYRSSSISADNVGVLSAQWAYNNTVI